MDNESLETDSVTMTTSRYCNLKGRRRVCCCEVDLERSGGWAKKLFLAWLFFAIFSKILAFYVLATVSYSSLWQSVVNLYNGNRNNDHHGNQTVYLSNAFGVPGLGNTMFQYASLYGLAKTLHRTAVISESMRLNNCFRRLPVLLSNETRPGISWLQFPEMHASAYDQRLVYFLSKTRKNAELVGYFQSWKYFETVLGEIRQQFTFADLIQKRVRKINSGISKKFHFNKNAHQQVTFVGVHVRRGDMTEERFRQHGYTTANTGYIHKAMKHFESKYSNIVFVVCSNDIDWCRANINTTGRKVHFSVGQTDLVDLALLGQCHHTIMTVGTYGWWAGFLAGGDVTYFQDYPLPGSPLERAFSKDKRDYYLPNWVGLSSGID